MIRKLIEEIIEKYYREDGEYYSRDREDESGNDLEMCKEPIKANVCPEDCDMCAWNTKGGVSYENH